MTALDQVVDKYLNDAGFRDQLTADPAAALETAGLTLTEDETVSLGTTLASLGAADLTTRVSKALTAN